MSSAAVVIAALRVKRIGYLHLVTSFHMKSKTPATVIQIIFATDSVLSSLVTFYKKLADGLKHVIERLQVVV